MVSSTTAAGTISQTARGLASFLTKSASEDAPTAFSLASSCHGLRRHVEDDAFVAALDEPAHHVRTHPAEADHSQLHRLILLCRTMFAAVYGFSDASGISKMSTHSR